MNRSRTFLGIDKNLKRASVDSMLYTLVNTSSYANQQLSFSYFCALFILATNGAVFTWFDDDAIKYHTIINLNHIHFLSAGAKRDFSYCTFPECIQGYTLSDSGLAYLNQLGILSFFQKLSQNSSLWKRIFNNHRSVSKFIRPDMSDYSKFDHILKHERIGFKNLRFLHSCYNHLINSSALSETNLINFLIQNHIKITVHTIQSLKYNLFRADLHTIGAINNSDSILETFTMLN